MVMGDNRGTGSGSLAGVFGVRLLDPDECRKAVAEWLHPEGARCPGCGESIREEDKAHRFAAGERVVCSGCGKRFSFLTGTCLSGSHLDARALVLLAFLAAEGFKVGRMAEILNLDRSTVRAWKEKLTEKNA